MNDQLRTSTWRSDARSIAIFTITAFGLVRGLDKVMPFSTHEGTTIKVDAFAEQTEGCNVLLLGSSAVYRGTQPKLFDQVTKKAGLKTKTFNMGIPGTTIAECHYMLQCIEETKPKDLRWILVEADVVTKITSEGPFLDEKSVAWHDFDTVRHLMGFAASKNLPWRVEAGSHWRNAILCIYNELGVGRGVPWIKSSLSVDSGDQRKNRWLGPHGDGYHSIADKPLPGALQRRSEFLASKQPFMSKYASMASEREVSEIADVSAAPFFRRIEELAESMGARAIFYTRIGSYDDREVVALSRDGYVNSLIRMDDEDKYPEVISPRFTWDGTHFTQKGSKLFTRHLAGAFAAHVKAAGKTQN
ncbi:MAG: hypothetical protein ACI8X5_001724 [Planctomycetota bacterium]|jgi:hypothetical protein